MHMIFEELKKIVDSNQQQGINTLYLKNMLREHLQLYILNFIYNHDTYNNLIFTGGTCLRHLYGLERLSKDLDFDYHDKFDSPLFKQELHDYFTKRFKYTDIRILLKQQEKRIDCKFPVLKQLGIAGKNDSDFLIINVDLSQAQSRKYTTEKTPLSKFGFNFIVTHYDLPNLFAGKIHAALMRDQQHGQENRKTIKGRDFYDLIWFLKKSVFPNLDKLSDQLGEKISEDILVKKLDTRVNEVCTHYLNDLESDLISFIANRDFVFNFRKNFKDEYNKYRSVLHYDKIQLFVLCKKCKKEFRAGIQVAKSAFESLSIINAGHSCPYCKTENILNRDDYIIHGIDS